jgi:hypothetical protein
LLRDRLVDRLVVGLRRRRRRARPFIGAEVDLADAETAEFSWLTGIPGVSDR